MTDEVGLDPMKHHFLRTIGLMICDCVGMENGK